ncbi:hypothetical protein ACVDG5_028180 [Mesorhizobium sp. ORM6]
MGSRHRGRLSGGFCLAEKSADLGNPAALDDLGALYEKGLGQAPDRTKALEFYRRSAELGNAAGKADLQRLLTAYPRQRRAMPRRFG